MAAIGKNILPVFQLLSSKDMSVSFTSQPTDIRWLDNIWYRLTWSGVPVGTWNVQVSSDYLPPPAGSGTPQNAGTWDTLPLSQAITASGSADTALIDLNQVPAPFVRLSYTATSGTGSASAQVSGKGV